MRVCLTGGAGYIGSHILVGLLDEDHDVLVVDNYENSSPKPSAMFGTSPAKHFEVLDEDICNAVKLGSALSILVPKSSFIAPA